MAKIEKSMPQSDRPYEKLELYGESNLTDSELLSIVIKTGTRNLSCLDISRNILSSNNNYNSDLEYLNSLSLNELKKFDGIGRVKAIQIKAVCELSKRLSKVNTNLNKITCPKDVYDLLHYSYVGKKQEIIKSVLLDNSNNVLSIVTNAIGNISSVNLGIKEFFSEPVKQLASKIVLVHNHPSGSLIVSRADINFTNRILEVAKLFEIEVVDHIIIAKDNYVSLKKLNKV